MYRKYILVNTCTGYLCYSGRRFFTAKGANRARLRLMGPSIIQIRKIISTPSKEGLNVY